MNLDFADNLEEIEGLRYNINKRFNAVDSIFYYLDKKRIFNDSLKAHIENMSGIQYFNSANTTYKYIESNGLNVISNDTLRAAITKIYENDFKNLHLRIENERHLKNDYLWSIRSKHFTSSKSLSKNPKLQNINMINTPLNITELGKNIEYRNNIVKLQILLNLQKIGAEETITKLKSLIQNLNIEIERLK